VKNARAPKRSGERGRTNAGERLTELFLMVFRVHGSMLSRGNELVGSLNLSSHRWQVMSAVRETPLTMAQIARRMGLTRQGVRQVVMQLIRAGIVALAPNPDHIRARLVTLTSSGRNLLKRVDFLQANWVNGLAANLNVDKLILAHRALSELCAVLEWRKKPYLLQNRGKSAGGVETNG
jgi:DNA-binding MarR family transcriptional regulator